LNKPLVSIITPTYNHEKFITQCIDSVLAQSFCDWEMIIIDDASTDKTPYIIEKYVNSDMRIKFIRHKQNWGIHRLGKAYNQALKLAQGDYIAILEGDDFWPTYKLERQLSGLTDSEKILSWGRVFFVNTDGSLIRTESQSKLNTKMIRFYRNDPPGLILNYLLLQNIIPPITAIIRKETLISIGGFQQPSYVLYVDYPTWLKLALEGKFDFIDETLGFWRRHERQITAKFKLELESRARQLAINFYNGLPCKIKNSLDINEKKIVGHWNIRIAKAYFYIGRTNLVNKEWIQAKRNFLNARSWGSYLMRSICLLGLIASMMKFNLEPLASLFNKKTLIQK